MTGLAKAILRFLSRLMLAGGPLLAILIVLGSLAGVFGRFEPTAQAGLGISLGLYVLFWSLLLGGVLRLLVSIDDRLERLEGKQ